MSRPYGISAIKNLPNLPYFENTSETNAHATTPAAQHTAYLFIIIM
jgi:hypothetical protein